MKKILFALTMLLSLGSTLWIEKVSAKTVNYIIRNSDDWKRFRDEVQNSKGKYWVDARLEADITTGLGIGITADTPYRGTFDGNGHTMTVDINRGDGKPCALFCYVGDVTIRNLHVKGKINGGIHSAGLIGCRVGSPTITLDRVWVSTEVTASSTHAAGVLGHAGAADVYMTDVRFDGKVVTNNQDNNSYAGCFIGWGGEGSWTFHRVYNASENSKFTAWRIWFCVDSSSGSGKAWGSNSKSSNTMTNTAWGDWGVTYYNMTDQNEVVELMNSEQPGSWGVVDGKAVPMMGEAYAIPRWQPLSEGSSRGRTLTSGQYYVTRDVTFNNGSAGGSGLTIAGGATVHIYVPKGVTLTASGADASGRTGGGAGILLPQGSTLYLEGGGTVEATGGKAADGSDGENGNNASFNESLDKGWAGSGGYGGRGGGGAGAGIGTCGGDGGVGGSGATGYWHNNNHNGSAGSDGSSGSSASTMGSLYVDQGSGLTVKATGGKKATRNGRGGSGGISHIQYRGGSYDTFSMAGGGGGGGGGYGGAASDIGTGGPGGGGGGGGSNGAMGSKYYGYYSEYANGGEGGQNADGNNAPNGGGAGADPDNYNAGRCTYAKTSESWVRGKCNHNGGGGRASGGSRGSAGQKSTASSLAYKYLINYKVMDSFKNGSVQKTISCGYKSNVNRSSIIICIPSHYEQGLIQQDKYLEQWNTRSDGKGSWHTAGHSFKVSQAPTDLYAEWKDYKDIFPEGYGSKSKPFIIKDAQLLSLADYVNNGGNTRGLYFKQQHDIIVSNILKNNNRGTQWTPIGHACVFEGDYDGGSYLIRDGEIASKVDNKELSNVGIFGKVMGSIHNLGVEALIIRKPDNDYVRCGAIAGRLVSEKIEQRAGQMRDCYAAGNNVAANFVGCVVGEMGERTSLSHCLETGNALSGAHAGSFSSIIQRGATVDWCFTSGGGIAPDNRGTTTDCLTGISASDMASGKITWLLNDNSAFATTWYQNVDRGTRDAHPVLSTASSRVFHEGKEYSNEQIGGIKLTGKGLKDDPFLVGSKEDLGTLAAFCNSGNNTAGMYFLQTADIDLKGASLTPIGSSGSFAGNYNGGGYTIRNGKISAPTYAGVFGIVSGTITRLGVENMIINYEEKDGRSGGIAARLRGNGEISYCFVKGCTVTSNGIQGIEGQSVAGAIVSDMFDNAVIKGCLTLNNDVSATRAAHICSDTKSGTQIEWCCSDGANLTSSDSYGNVSNSFPSVSEARLEDGSVTYKLNGGFDNPDPAWFQNIAQGSVVDKTPVLSSDHAVVYRVDGIYTNDGEQLGKLGKGTETDPYKIGTPADLKKLIISVGSMKRSNFYVRQTADIDMADSLVVPIGTCTAGFEGHYDGGGYVIKNLTMRSYKDESMGLFNNIIGTVENLGIENSTFTAEDSVTRVGALAGKLTRKGVVRNCYVKDSKIDFHNTAGVVVGALIGEQTDTSRVEACYGYRNTVIGQDDGQRHYGHVLGYIGSKATASLLFTDGATLCADKQSGAKNITSSETEVTDFRFNSGEVCYLLNGSKDNGQAWRQTFRTDNTPVTNASHLSVYRHTLDYQALYTNSNDVPYSVWLILQPNYDKAESKSIEVFKADDNLNVPSFKLQPHAVDRLNYDLLGWNTQADGKGQFYPYDGEVVPTGRLTLYAMWGLKVPSTMPLDGTTRVVTLEKDAVYPVYDDAGSRSPYGYDYNGKLILKAPAGHILCLSGTVATEAAGTDGNPHDYMIVYDGDATSTKKLANGKGVDTFYSQTSGEKEDIGKLLSSGVEMTIEFVTDSDKCFDGLDLQVAVLPNDILDLAGTGTEESPFQVESVKDLNAVNDYIRITGNSNIYIKQVDDIDLNGETFTPLASSVTTFEGHYDGGGYAISNMKTDGAGLFRNVNGVVERLGMVNCTIAGAADNLCVGIIAGSLSGNGQVRNCYAIGNGVSFVGQDKVFTMGTEYTAEQFASGEVCYLLNGEKSDSSVVWRQTLGTDTVPVFTDNHGVVYTYQRNDKPAYSNTVITTPQYYISSKEDFKAFIEKEGDIHLTQDIDVGNTGFCLKGNFDGGGHTITYGGDRELFKKIEEGGTVKHLRVEANIETTYDCGGIAYKNKGTISDCHFRGVIRGRGSVFYGTVLIAGIALKISENGTIDHCSFTGQFIKENDRVKTYPITKDTDRATNCTWVDSNDQTLYAAQRDSALAAQAEYPVYAKGILDAVGPELVLGNDTIYAPGRHLTSLTIVDGERFKCPAEVNVYEITYKRRGTNGAYEPWVLPFDHTIDASMLNGGVEFYRFEEDNDRNLQTKQINSGETYQVAANEPLAIRTTDDSEHNFQMKLVTNGPRKPFIIKMPLDGIAASLSSTKDIARVMVAYDSIPAGNTLKKLMYIWNNDKADFTLSDGEKGVTPFRYYLQYVDKATGNLEEYGQTDWARKQRKKDSGASQLALNKCRAAQRAALSEMTAQGWQAIFLEPRSMPEVTTQMLDDYEILALSDLYETKASADADGQRYAVTVIYEPVEAGMTLPNALPLLVRAKRADVEPLVTEQLGSEITEALKRVEEEVGEEELMEYYEQIHYWCSTFNGRYDVWQLAMPESDSVLNEYGAFVFADKGNDQYFYRVPASDGYSMKPMSYCFTAYDVQTFENLPLANDRIEIVVIDNAGEPTGIEEVRGKKADVRGDVYNLSGQRVGDSYRGIVIQNGRKIVGKVKR